MPEVYFCNLCDQSVPLVEIEEGKARRVGDRVLCHTCRTLLGVSMAKGRGASAGTWFAVALGLIAVMAAGFAWLEGDRGDRTLSTSLETSVGTLSGRHSTLEERLEAAFREASESRALLGGEISALRDTQSEAGKAMEARLEALQAAVDDFGRYIADQETVVRRIDQMEATLSVVEDRVRGYRADLIALRDEVDRQRDLVHAVSVTASDDAGSNEFSPEVSALLRQLQDEDPEVRYSALERLQPLQDPRLLPHVYPALSDPYEFTRFLAAHILGEWGARPAAPHLIEALMDEVGFVREAAVRSLRRLTGQNFGFNHADAQDARRRAYLAWKTWWSESGQDFLEQRS